MKGIDVSRWQGDINWSSVKESGVNFAIIKAGGSDDGFYTDSNFEQNYIGATRAGVNVGAYYFVGSKCISYEDGVADAERFIEIIKDKRFEYPLFIDLESTSMADRSGATEACIGFCETMEDAGYFAGIYASDIYGFKDRLDLNRLAPYSKWVACYGSRPSYVKEYGMWQSSSSGKISGINGNVDIDESFVDYPTVIKNAGLNGSNKPIEDTIDWKAKYLEAVDTLDEIKDKLDRIRDILRA